MIRTWLGIGIAATLGVVGRAGASYDITLEFPPLNSFGTGWEADLNIITAAAGVPAFNATERADIQSRVLADLQTIYSGYQVNFTIGVPNYGVDDYISFVKFSDGGTPDTLGEAPLDIGNLYRGEGSTVITRNFTNFIQSTDNRPTQIAQISRALAGTAAHELAHSFGLDHQHAYADPGITPANYANTQGLQNQYIMATGPTGLTEAGRESLRSFNRWERAMLDITGGTIDGGHSIVQNPVLSQNIATDAGNTRPTAYIPTFTTGQTSGLQLALLHDDLEAAADIDIYRIDLTVAAYLTANAFSVNLFPLNEFDPLLRLRDSAGNLIAFNDDVRFSLNAFGTGTMWDKNPFLLNIPLLAPGTYYVEVAAQAGGAAQNEYQLLIGLAPVPEPASMLSVLLLTPLVARRRVGTR